MPHCVRPAHMAIRILIKRLIKGHSFQCKVLYVEIVVDTYRPKEITIFLVVYS